jgi:hypothetical protein
MSIALASSSARRVKLFEICVLARHMSDRLRIAGVTWLLAPEVCA